MPSEDATKTDEADAQPHPKTQPNPQPFPDANTGALDVLYAIWRLDEPNGSEITRNIPPGDRHRSPVHKRLLQLLQNGYIERRDTPNDRPEYLYSLTEDGQTVIEADFEWRKACVVAGGDNIP